MEGRHDPGNLWLSSTKRGSFYFPVKMVKVHMNPFLQTTVAKELRIRKDCFKI